MKKLLLFVITLCMILVFLSSCSYKSNQWFSSEKLDKCLVPELPEIADNYLNKNDEDIYVKFSEDEYEDYVNQVYEYLKSKNFEYLGTRGELQSSLSGAFNTYYFQPADALEEFYVDGAYRFVYSDGKVEELDDTFRFRILTINTIGLNTTKTIEDNGLNFKYNTVISLRYNSEYPLNGRYVLKEYSISYESNINIFIDGYAPTSANAGETVIIRTHPVMDADLELYANGIKLEQTHADSDYWEFVFVMPEENVVISKEFIGGI